jgi:ribosomal protein L3 glutamine methyltransferase
MAARVTQSEREMVMALFKRRIEERAPIAYITHEAWFAGLKFFVDERVLVPRSPIAELIDSAFEPWIDSDQVIRVLDLCTGSACIAIACAFAFPEAVIDAVDISEHALEVAEINVRNYHLGDQLNLIKSDVFDQLEPQTYDLIVSNPPYVDAFDMDNLPSEYRHEPELGLAAGVDGLDIVARILRQAADYLSPEGILVVEVGNSQQALTEKYPNAPFTWMDFARGGEGVFILDGHTLREFSSEFNS